jgi:transposase InsO family protein
MHGAPHKAKTIISTTRCLELLHVDLFGPPSHESLGGKKYCLVIVDDYSRYCWVFFFKYKSETQRTMMEFANQVQRKYDTTILAIRSDNGTKFKNYTLDDFLARKDNSVGYRSGDVMGDSVPPLLPYESPSVHRRAVRESVRNTRRISEEGFRKIGS